MSATIFEFPKKTLNANKDCKTIPLYTEEEIYALLAAVNVFSIGSMKYNEKNINSLETEVILLCLESSLESDFFSDGYKNTIKQILNNVTA